MDEEECSGRVLDLIKVLLIPVSSEALSFVLAPGRQEIVLT